MRRRVMGEISNDERACSWGIGELGSSGRAVGGERQRRSERSEVVPFRNPPRRMTRAGEDGLFSACPHGVLAALSALAGQSYREKGGPGGEGESYQIWAVFFLFRCAERIPPSPSQEESSLYCL